MRRLLLLLACAAAWAPTPLRAQDAAAARDCEIVDGDDLKVLDQGTPFERVILRVDAHIRCRGGVELRADSAVSHSATGRREFIGHVVYRDSLKTLDADRVDYFHDQARLVARGAVVLTDLEEGSVITGTELEYFRETATRPEARTVVRGRPHAVLRDAGRPPEPGDTAGEAAGAAEAGTALPPPTPPGGAARPDGTEPADSTAPPLEIDADEMEILGERLFRAVGRVELERGATTGSAREAEFEQSGQRLLLIGDAIVEGERFTLTGDRIQARLDGDELREVHALRDAVLLSEELTVDAPELRVFFEAGEVHRMVAMRMLADTAAPPPALGAPDSSAVVAAPAAAGDSASAAEPAGTPVQAASLRTVGPQPRATAKEFRLTADSIDALAPGQRLERVVAVGNAYGERTADSLTAALPETIARDWLRGDTITGYFTTVPVTDSTGSATARADDAAPGDSAQTQTTLERLVAVGQDGRAQSLYRIQDEGEEAAGPSVNYLTANRIVLFLRAGEVTSVEADGPVKGIHLQPRPRREDRQEQGVADGQPPEPERP